MEATVMASDYQDIERRLSEIEPPRVVAGVHRECLREDLLRRMHEAGPRREASPASAWRWVMNGYRSGPILSRLAWVCGAVVLLGAVAWGSAQAVKKAGKVFVFDDGKAPPPITRTVKNPDGTTTMFKSMISSKRTFTSDDPSMTAEKARKTLAEVVRLVAEGKGKEVRREPVPPFGTRVSLRVTLADGTVVNAAHLVQDTPETSERRATMLRDAIAAGKSEFVRKINPSDGTTIYEYRARLADGTDSTYAENLPVHDKPLAKRHQDEIERARAEHKGTFLRALEIPGQPRTNVYQVRLSDGDVAVYFSPDPPAKETPRNSK
jgi:hypothetical protein